QHLVAIENPSEASDKLAAIGRCGQAMLPLQKLVDATLLLLHPGAGAGALEQVVRRSRLRDSLEQPPSGIRLGGEARGICAQVKVAVDQQKRVGEDHFEIAV